MSESRGIVESGPEAVDPAAENLELRAKLARVEARLTHANICLDELRAYAKNFRTVIGDRDAWEWRNQETAQRWRAKNQALARELQLAQVGLSSGCGCPIGDCQGMTSKGQACWQQWAESHLARRMADIRISEFQRHAVHPSRFAQARFEGKTAQPLQSPDPDGIVREPGIEGGGGSDVSFREPR